jgi:putative FmdB family regulatory protein
MTTYDYLCLECGAFWTSGTSGEEIEDQGRCPQCGSTNTARFNPASLYGLFSGCG